MSDVVTSAVEVFDAMEKALRQMLNDYEDQYGVDYCECPHEPYNRHLICGACQARAVLDSIDKEREGR